MIDVSASLLAADFARLEAEITRMKAAGADSIHYDVMDGRFVPEISFGQVVLSCLSDLGLPFHVHMMTLDPLKQLPAFVKAGAASFTIHAEAENVEKAVNEIHAAGLRAGVSVKPGTPVEALFPVIDTADRFLVMTVEPGYGGQKMIKPMLSKVETLKKMLAASGREAVLEIDGGVNMDTAADGASAGVSSLVIGSALFGSSDTEAFIKYIHSL